MLGMEHHVGVHEPGRTLAGSLALQHVQKVGRVSQSGAGWDGIASMLIGLLLAATAWVLAAEMKALLVGESATREERSEVRAAILSIPEVHSIDRLLTMQLSPHEVLVNVDVNLDPGLSGEDVDGVIDRIDEAIKEAVPEATRVFIEPGLVS